MKTIPTLVKLSLIGAVVLSLGACADMSRRDRDTAVGAGVGAVLGSVVTGGSTGGAVGGAVIGGVIGHETNKDRK